MKARERGGIISKLIVWILVLSFCGLVYLVRHPLLRFAGGLCITEDSLAKSDTIVVLSDDNFNADRSARAAELFRAGWAPRIVASGRRLRPYASVAELMAHDLTDRGIPKDAVVRFPESGDSTREEAQALVSLATERKWNRLIIVTSNYHTRRARYIFRHVFPAAIEIRVASARDSEYDPDHWWETRKGIKHFFNESGGMAVAIWESRR
jgi:uncharacterized SAM-binding protein YcdF (DUF218 family)